MNKAHRSALLQLLRPYWLQIAGALIHLLFTTATTLLTSYFLGKSMDAALSGNTETLFSSLVYLIIIWSITGLSFGHRLRLLGFTAEDVCADLRQALVLQISRLPISELEKRHSSDYVSRLSHDVTLIKDLINRDWVQIARGLLGFIAALTMMLVISWKVTLTILITTPLLIVLTSLLSSVIAKHTLKLQKDMAELNAIAQDAATGILVTKAYNLESVMGNRFQRSSEQVAYSSIKLATSQGYLSGGAFALSMAPFFILFGIGGYEVIQGSLTFGGLLMLINLTNQLTYPLQTLTKSWGQSKAALKASERLFELLSLPHEPQGNQDLSINPKNPILELNDVGFGYTAEKPVFNNLNLKVDHGETIAIVGPSGQGKSTLLALLAGLRTINQGVIKIYGQPMSDLTMHSVREKLSYVPQDGLLFSGTVAENIGYGKLGATKEEIIEAAQRAFAHDFIQLLPQGYQTLLGERGLGLSGGQKQRIALARAFIKDAPILLLDEATSALDTESEAQVQAAIDTLRRGRTTIIIAHRLSTIRSADRILVLNQGNIVEEGNHLQLLAQCGLYSKLYVKENSQSDLALAAGSL